MLPKSRFVFERMRSYYNRYAMLPLIGLLLVATSCSDNFVSWQKAIAKPGFKLLDSSETADYFVAVYDTGKNEIAFYDCWLGNGKEPDGYSLRISDEKGDDLIDLSRKNKSDLRTKHGFGSLSFVSWSRTHGICYPLRVGYRSKIAIRFIESGGRTIYEKNISSISR